MGMNRQLGEGGKKICEWFTPITKIRDDPGGEKKFPENAKKSEKAV